MGRLNDELLRRVEAFSDRVIDVASALDQRGCWRRLVEQIAASGTSVGANTFEADEAMSRADFCKTLAIANKELAETRFWVRLIARRGWLPAHRLAELEAESLELKRIFGAIVHNSRPH